VRTQQVSLLETDQPRSTQQFGSSYFLPKIIFGEASTFLLNTGCTINLLCQRLFDTLGAQERASLEPCEGAHGKLVDGSYFPFYGIITLPGQVHDQVIHETFIVSHLKEDANLVMPLLEKHQCHMDFQKSAVVMAWKELAYVDKFSRPLVGGVQVVWDCTIPGRSQATLRCRFNCKEIADLGVVGNARSDSTGKQPELAGLSKRAPRAVHRPLHGIGPIIGWSAGGEVPLHPKS